MSAISIRTVAVWLLALTALALPLAVRDSGRAVARSDAPLASSKPHDARVLRPQTLAVLRTERQRPSDGGYAILPLGAPVIVSDRSATPTLRLDSLALRLWPRVGHQRDPPEI